MVAKQAVSFSKLIDPALRRELFKTIQNETEVSTDGRVTWSGFKGIDQYVSVLGDAFVFPTEISRREAAAAVWRGILNARKAGNLTDSSVIEALQRLINDRLSEPLRTFSMWSRLSLSIPQSARGMRFVYADVRLQLTRRLPQYMEISDVEFAKLSPIATKDKPGFGFVIASTKARNAMQAADKLFGTTEIFQAVLNLAVKPWNLMGSEQKPEAALLTGPYQFLFEGRKSLVDKAMWFNPSFRDEHWSQGAKFDDIYNHAPSIRKALGKLESHPLREALSAAFLMMNDGMEAADMTRRTMRYWTALERLFQAGDERVSYEKIIRRATYLDDPPDLARAKLARLMRIRNRYVHMGQSENEHHQLTQYLASEVRSHLFYLVFNGDDFSDHGEFLEMTDLPSDDEALQRRRRAIDRRERMIEKRRHRAD